MSIIQANDNTSASTSPSPSFYSQYSSSSTTYTFPPSLAFDFPVAAHLARRLRLASPSPGSYYSDELVQLLIGDLESESAESRRVAAMELRLLAKEEDAGSGDSGARSSTTSSIRLRMAAAGAILPLVDAISDPSGAAPDPELHEHAVTAVLNLSLSPANTAAVLGSGAAAPLCRAVADRVATPAARANAACALMRLARSGGPAASRAIGRAGAVPALAGLLGDGTATLQEHKDAAAAMYTLCAGENADNAARAVEAGAVETLVRMVAEEVLEEAEEVDAPTNSTPPRTQSSLSSSSLASSSSSAAGMADRALCVLSAIVAAGGAAAAEAVAGCGGLGVLVELLQGGTRRQREAAADMLMRVCGGEGAEHLRRMAAREGAVPPLVALSQTGSPRARKTAEALTALLRMPRSGSTGSNGSSSGRGASRMAEAAAI